jgi:hypothetical protein
MVNKTFEPTPDQRKQVEAMKGFGIPEPDIALLIINPRTNDHIARDTLRKHFKYELAVGAAKANSKVAESLYKQATDGNTSAAIWWSKTRMGWKETQGIEHSGSVSVSWDD